MVTHRVASAMSRHCSPGRPTRNRTPDPALAADRGLRPLRRNAARTKRPAATSAARSRAPMAWRRFLQMPGAWTVQGFAMFSVIEKSSGRWLGQAGPWQPEGWPGTEVGWSLPSRRLGQGLRDRGRAAAIDWAFDKLGWSEVIHSIDPGNAASQAVARRAGVAQSRSGRLPAPLRRATDRHLGPDRARNGAHAARRQRA